MKDVAGRFIGVEIVGVPDAVIRGEASLTVTAEGWEIQQREASKWIRYGLGVPAFIAAIVLVAVGASMLEGTGFDLMSYRKGPVLVGMIGLGLGIGAWTFVSALSNRLMGKDVRRHYPRVLEAQDFPQKKGVILIWANPKNGQRVSAVFQPHAEQEVPALIAAMRLVARAPVAP